MVDGGLVGGVKIIGEDVEPVEVLVQLWHIIALIDVFYAGGHGHGQEETCPSRLLRLPLEFGSKLLDELGVVVAVPGLAAFAVGGVLPVEVDTVEVVLAQELQDIFDELLSTIRTGHQGGEARTSLVPASDSNHGL